MFLFTFWAHRDVKIITHLHHKSQTKTYNDSTNKKHAQILSCCFEDDTNDGQNSRINQGCFSTIVSCEIACKQGGHSSCKRNRSRVCLQCLAVVLAINVVTASNLYRELLPCIHGWEEFLQEVVHLCHSTWMKCTNNTNNFAHSVLQCTSSITADVVISWQLQH